tara:strand:- start:404 stop:568 length:165 start_codon:yes stop_codon:yes gene_type:complete
MKTYAFSRIEKIKSIQIFQAESKEQAEKMLEIEGFDEKCDEIISSEVSYDGEVK